MASVYRDSDGKLLLLKSFCAYIDILGFSEMIKANDLVYFNKYLRVLQSELNHIEQVHDLSGKEGLKQFELKIFTDNFIFGHPWNDQFGESELGNIFEVLSHIQLTFAKSNFFVRGAVSVSDLVMDENVVLGPAIIESYKLESEKAVYPRIILSDDVVKVLQEHLGYYGDHENAPQSTEYLIDVDGYYFVNYLYTMFYDEDPPMEYVVEELVHHKNTVFQNLEEFAGDFKLFDKYAWVAKYHNYFCDNFIVPRFPTVNRSVIKIDSCIYQKSIKRLV